MLALDARDRHGRVVPSQASAHLVNPDNGLSGIPSYGTGVRDETAFSDTVAGEKQTLASFLRFHQDTLLTKLDGLPDDELCRVGAPSGLSLIGLLKHATY